MAGITIAERQLLQAATNYGSCPHCGAHFASSVSGLLECGTCDGLIHYDNREEKILEKVKFNG